MNKENLNENLNTAYDDAYHTLLHDCPTLITPVVNEVFGKDYARTEIITPSNKQFFINKKGGGQVERVADSIFKIGEQTYHIECQSTADGTMIMRMFEYDSQAALQDGIIKKNVLTVEFPNAAILYLRHNGNTPERMVIELKVPGDICKYEVPIIKMQLYTVDELFEKNLLFLIPFHIFAYENQFAVYETDERKLDELKKVYEDIVCRLNDCAKQGLITEYEKTTILDMSRKVLQKIAMKYSNVKEGVGDVMGGRILDYEAKDILNQGKAEAVLELLEELGVVPQQIKDKVINEKNVIVLSKWLKLAAKAESIEEFIENM